jgi:hypothetical protein
MIAVGCGGGVVSGFFKDQLRYKKLFREARDVTGGEIQQWGRNEWMIVKRRKSQAKGAREKKAREKIDKLLTRFSQVRQSISLRNRWWGQL